MSDSHDKTVAIVNADGQAITPDREPLHPLIQAAQEINGLTPENIGKMMDLQERYEAKLAKDEFEAARSALLEDLPTVISKNRKGHVARYADLPQVMRSVMPALRKHGFSVSWTNSWEGRDEIVTCHLGHRGGHEETNPRRGSVESKKGQSGVQSSQCTVTYLQRHALLSILGLSTDDAPDADESKEPERPDMKAINHSVNLKAAASLREECGGLDEAVKMVGGRGVKEWTAADIVILRDWMRMKMSERRALEKEALEDERKMSK